jgi:hypothetical protein
MTLRTVTFNPATHHVVPIEPMQEMLSAMAECDGYLPGDRDRPTLARWEDYWRMAMSATPDTLPGVIEHSGEPVAWIDEVGQLVVLEKFIKQHIGYVSEGREIPEAWQPLFTHAAPAQPDAMQPGIKITDEEMDALRRFDETCEDGEGWDVQKTMMQRLAEIGLIRRKSGNYYEFTTFGQYVIDPSRARQLDCYTCRGTGKVGEEPSL